MPHMDQLDEEQPMEP